MASAPGEKRVLLSYSPEDEEIKETIAKDLTGEKIEVATSDTIPVASKESNRKWSERKCKSVVAVLVVMTSDYQEDEECIADAEAATFLKSEIFFAKAKNFEENEWMKNIRGDSKVFDLTSTSKYKNNMKRLIASLKQILCKQGIF